MKPLFVSIDYDEDTLEYMGVISDFFRWNSGSPVRDWSAMVEWCKFAGFSPMHLSSVTHFVMDAPYHFVIKDGYEQLAKDEEP